MSEISEETRAKALEAIRLFCQKPHTQHGRRRTTGERKGWYEFHDWGHLAMRLHHLYFGTVPDVSTAATIAQPLRREYTQNKDWNKTVNRPGAHEHIREMFEQGVAALTPAATTAGA